MKSKENSLLHAATELNVQLQVLDCTGSKYIGHFLTEGLDWYKKKKLSISRWSVKGDKCVKTAEENIKSEWWMKSLIKRKIKFFKMLIIVLEIVTITESK